MPERTNLDEMKSWLSRLRPLNLAWRHGLTSSKQIIGNAGQIAEADERKTEDPSNGGLIMNLIYSIFALVVGFGATLSPVRAEASREVCFLQWALNNETEQQACKITCYAGRKVTAAFWVDPTVIPQVACVGSYEPTPGQID